MSAIRFQWDDKKAAANKAKHGVSFEEAKTVFYDEDALLRTDDEHSTTKIDLSCWASAQVFERLRSVTVIENRTK